METQRHDVAIVGCGPAGLSAAIYTSRAGLNTVIFGDHTKSSLYKSHAIANYFGFSETVTGYHLTRRGVKQAKNFGVKIIPDEIIDIHTNHNGSFALEDSRKKHYIARTVIIATGQSYTLSGIKNERELTGKGVSYCVVCDGFFFKNKKVVVIGDGNYAGEEAVRLLNYTKDVTILSHGKEFNFSKEIKKDLKASGIKMLETARIREITGKSRAETLLFADGTEMKVQGVFMAIGSAGATAFAKKLGLEMVNNYIKVDMDGNTGQKGVFAAGDCTGSPAQIATCVGSGCNAALSAINLLKGTRIYIQYN